MRSRKEIQTTILEAQSQINAVVNEEPHPVVVSDALSAVNSSLLTHVLEAMLDLRDQNERIITLLERQVARLSDAQLEMETEMRKFWNGDRTQ